MKKHLTLILYMTLILSCTNMYAQEVNITFNATIRNSSNTILPDTYIKVYSPDETAAVDSMFSNDQGMISRVLPFTYLNSSVQTPFKQKSGYLVKKISPNILTAKDMNLMVEYNYPDWADIFFMNTGGKLFPNHSTLTPGIYMYFLRFDDGRQSELNKLVVTCELPVHIQLVNSLQRNISNKKVLLPVEELDEFYIEVLKDGYITHYDTIFIDTAVIEREYHLDEASIPSAEFSYTGDLTCGLPVVFNASGSKGAVEEELNYHWDFGDGLNGGSSGITHVYTLPGTYDVTLTVSGNYGARKSITKSLSISPGAIAVENTGLMKVYMSNEFFEELEEVRVELVEGDQYAYSDMEGIATLDGLPLGIPLHLKLTKGNYVTQVITVTIPEDSKEALSFATLKSRSSSQTVIDVEYGGEITGDDGSTVSLPILAFNDSEGNPVKGNVSVNITPVDVAFESESFPGNFEGYDNTGSEGVLFSYGVSEYHFEKDGEELQLAEGKTATVLIPIYTSGATPGDQIPLWSVNEENGKWIQEGVGTVVESASSPTGLALQAEVSHFSWFNCDDFQNGRQKSGLCWKWDCTTAQCIKVKVGCWVKGARRNGSGKKSGNNAHSRKQALIDRDTIPPVFEARSFLNPNGTVLLMPYTSDVYMESVSVDEEGHIWTGVYTLPAGYESDTFSIQVIQVDENPVIDMEINTIHEGFLKAGELQQFNFNINEAGEYQLIYDQGDVDPLQGSYVLIYGDGIIKEGSINEYNNYLELPVGSMNVKVVGLSSLHQGNFVIGLGQSDVWLAGDTTDMAPGIRYDDYIERAQYKYYRISTTSEDLFKIKLGQQTAPVLQGRFKVFSATEVLHSGYIDNLYIYRTFESGQTMIGVAGNNLGSYGNFYMLVEKPELNTLGLNDSIYAYLSPENHTLLYKLSPDHNTLLKLRYYVSGELNQTVYVKLFSSSGQLLAKDQFSKIESMMLPVLQKDSSYYLEVYREKDMEFVLISAEEPVTAAVQGDTITGRLEYKKDKDIINFSGTAGDRVRITGTKPEYRPSNGIFSLLAPNGERMSTMNLKQEYYYTDHEIFCSLPSDGEYSIIVESTQDDTGAYQIVIDSLKTEMIDHGHVTRKELAAGDKFCYEFEWTKDHVCYISLLGENTSGNFNVWNENGIKMNRADLQFSYNVYSHTGYNDYFEKGRYFISGENTGNGSIYINLQKPNMLETDLHGKAMTMDTIPNLNEVNTYCLKASPGDGMHLSIEQLSMMPYPERFVINTFHITNYGYMLPTMYKQGDIYPLDKDFLVEARARITGEASDSLFTIVVSAETAGLYQFTLHHVKSALDIKVDDDFSEYPDAVTASPIAAGLAVKKDGSIQIADGIYRTYLPIQVEADGVRIEGQSRENTWLLNLFNQSSNPVIYHWGDGGEIRNFTMSNGPAAYDIMEVYGDNYTLEQVDVTKIPGQTRIAGGIKVAGDNMYINDLYLDSIMWDIHGSSKNGIIENCLIVSESGGIKFSGTNNIIRNNNITLTTGNRAIIVEEIGDGYALVENNEIDILSLDYSTEDGIIYMRNLGSETNTNTSLIRNNTIRTKSRNSAFYALNGKAPSKIIVEGNRYYSSNPLGSRAFMIQPARTDGYSDIIVRNNTFEGISSDYSVYVYGISQVIGEPRFMICNNSFRFADESASSSTNNFMNLYAGGSAITDTLQIYFINNIVEGNGSSNFVHSTSEALFFSDYNNLYQFNTMTGGNVGIIGQEHDIVTDPQYLNEDLEVDASSGVVDEGAGIGEFLFLPEVDINGVTRPQGEGVDIGAYER